MSTKKLLLQICFVHILLHASRDWPVVQGLPTSAAKHNEFTIHQALEQTLLNDTTGELFRLRNAFFPSSAERNPFWKVDGLQTIQLDACLNITNLACQNKEMSHSVFDNGTNFAHCWVYQWTNNYLLGLMATNQLYQFEPVISSVTYLQTVGHREVTFRATLNLTDSILCSLEQKDLEKYFTSFMSWTKAYAVAEGKPTSWSADVQGYISRKYNTYTKGIEGDQLQYSLNFTILVGFVCCNILVAYLIIACGGRLYHKASNSTEHTSTSAIKKTACKGLMFVAGCLLVPLYAIGLFIAHAGGVYPKYYPPCTNIKVYDCEPAHSSYIYKLEVASFYCKVSISVAVLCLYLLSAFFTVARSNSPPLLFQKQSLCRKCAEIYFWWTALLGIHICLGLATIPMLMLLIITPTYTLFFIISIGIIITICTMPVIICLQFFRQNRLVLGLRMCKLLNMLFVYVLISTFTVVFAYLYYCFLLGGASMSGVKGVFFSLIPPGSVAIAGFFVKYRFFTKDAPSQDAHEPTETDKLINNTEEA